jgi:hypothetical protein
MFLTLALVMASAVLGFQDAARSIERNTGLAVGISMMAMLLSILAIYCSRRDIRADLSSRFQSLSSATGKVMGVTWAVAMGGLAVLIIVAALKAYGIVG